MRGESGEVIIRSGSVVTGDDMDSIRQNIGGNKGTSSPPLSAAVSQVSLAPSDLTTSDPDIAASSAYSSAPSSRPQSTSQMSLATSDLTSSDLDLAQVSSVPSSAASSRPPSSSGLGSTNDLVLPAPEDYTTETVEFPTSPMALKIEGGFMEASEIDLNDNGDVILSPNESNSNYLTADESNSNFLTPNYKLDELETPDQSLKPGDGFEVGSDLEEDYFEEYHLPNSHENTFVRHRSYRRKVHQTPINAPDAERIEGLVRTGEFERHGSIRRKITEEQEDMISESNENIQDAGREVSLPFAKDFKEIEILLNDDIEEDISTNEIENTSSDSGQGDLSSNDSHLAIERTSSTPLSQKSKHTNYETLELSVSANEESVTEDSNWGELSIEESTLIKVRECLDSSKYKDLYNLSGRLQDILSPKEVEAILNNSEIYSEYIDKEIIEALHNSLQEHLENISDGNIDSGISTPRKMISAEGVELETSVKRDIRAELDENSPVHETESNTSKRSSEIYVDEDLDDEENGFRFERRRSLRLSKEGVKELEVEGVFVESKSQDLGLKKIAAPEIDLTGTTDEATDDIPDLSEIDIHDVSQPYVKIELEQEENAQDSSAVLPDIVITNVSDSDDSEREDLSDISEYDINTTGITEVTTPNIDSPPQNNFKCSTPEEQERPSSLDFENVNHRRRISIAEDILNSPNEEDNISVASALSHRTDDEEDYDSIIADELEAIEADKHHSNSYPHFEPVPPPPDQLIPEMTASEETAEERHWRSIVIGGVWRRIDMKVIAPYRKCVSHGGYYGDEQNQNAVIVISACYLPNRSRRDYHYVMDNLFLYVLSTLEQLITEDYVLVYLPGGTPKSHMPTFHWLKRAYQMIDRKLRKNLKCLYVVHPTFWVRALVTFSRPFISSKFYRKLAFVNNLTELAQIISLDQLDIPDAVKQADFELMIREKKKHMIQRHRSPAVSR